jgi:hypothetical protein
MAVSLAASHAWKLPPAISCSRMGPEAALSYVWFPVARPWFLSEGTRYLIAF